MTSPAAPPRPSALPALARRGVVPLFLALAAGLLAGLAMNRILDQAISGRTQASAFAILARVGPEVEAILASGGDPAGAVERLGRQLSVRATLVSPDGKVLADSGVERARVASLESHAGRPEIREALEKGRGVRTRFSSTVGERLVYAAARLKGGGVLRVAFPERELTEWERPFRRRTLLLSVLAALLVASLLVRSRSRHAAEMRLVRDGVAAVARGDRPERPGDVSAEGAAALAALFDLSTLLEERAAEDRRGAEVARTVFEGVPAGILVLDARLSLLRANAEAVRLLGADAGAVRTGEHLLELVREATVAAFVESALASGGAKTTLALPPERGGRTLAAEAIPLAGTATPGQPAAIVILRESPAPPPG